MNAHGKFLVKRNEIKTSKKFENLKNICSSKRITTPLSGTGIVASYSLQQLGEPRFREFANRQQILNLIYKEELQRKVIIIRNVKLP